MRITVVVGTRTFETECKEGDNLLSVLRAAGLNLSAGCGGRGTCGKCRVHVRGGSFGAEEKEVLACQTAAEAGLIVRAGEYAGGGLTESAGEAFACDGEDGYGLAVDIGTTTVAYALCDLRSGEILKKHAELNRQASFGADVISRIMSAEEGNAGLLADAVRGQIDEEVRRCKAEFSLSEIKKVTVCGNTTMLHLLCGADVSGIGRYPFTPVFTEYRELAGDQLGICVPLVQILPSISAYVGADIVAGAIASGTDREEALLVDIGTNGEMLIHTNGKFLCTSTAAGPCFEGANIECGTGGVAGAVDSVSLKEGKIAFTTIGNEAPRGICGAGLVDALAVMLDTGAIDSSGTFEDGDRFSITDGVWISQKDVRNYQLAKSAIYSGIRVLVSRAGLTEKTLKKLYIAGGLGFYLNGENARKTGLLPVENAENQQVIGNAALAGTRMCMLSKAALGRAKHLAEHTEYVDLSADPEFMDEYVENMNFKGYDD